jgi:hypothetical protein
MTTTGETGRRSPPAVARSALVTPRRIIISVVVAGALALLVWGLSGTRPTSTPITYTNPAVQSVQPEPGVLALRQEAIGVTLKPNYTLAQQNTDGMSVNGTGIPQDEIQVMPSLNQYLYTPTSGKVVSALPPGRNCASVLIRLASDPSDPGTPFGWCFNSH